MKSLFEIMLKDIDDKSPISLLFTDSPTLYEPFGFRVIPQTYFTTQYDHDKPKNLDTFTKIDPFDPVSTALLIRLLEIREPTSTCFFPLQYTPSFFLNLYDPMVQARLYFIEDLDAILVLNMTSDTLELYDVISSKLPALSEICDRIPGHFSRIAVYFNPDRFESWYFTPTPLLESTKLMIRGDIEIPKQLHYPDTAKF